MEHFFQDTALTDYFPLPRGALDLDLPSTALVLYSVLLDRGTLSQKNGYVAEDGWVFVIYPIGELAEKLRSSPAAVKRHLKLLEDAGLIRRTRTEGNIASYIYLNLPAGSKSEPPQDQKSATDGAKMIPRAAQKRATSNPRKQPELTTQYYQHGEDESL